MRDAAERRGGPGGAAPRLVRPGLRGPPARGGERPRAPAPAAGRAAGAGRGGDHRLRHLRDGGGGGEARGRRLPAQALHPGPDPARGGAGGGAAGAGGRASSTWRSGWARRRRRRRWRRPRRGCGRSSRCWRRRPATTSRCCCGARAAPARGCWRGRSTRFSPRRGRPFAVVNCPTLTDELLASELFGHARGAFTGAVKDQPGRVEAAEGGTLFLDEIGEISPALQAKLLRFLQEKRFERVGETRTRTADVRIVAATNKDLEAEVGGGPLPRGPALPARRGGGDGAAAARAARGHPAAGAPLPGLLRPRARAARSCRRRRERALLGLRLARATCASCATRWSGR